MAGMDPFAHLLETTCDVVEAVLESYKEKYSRISPSNYHQIIKDIKALFGIVQKLESEFATGAFRSASPRAKKNISDVLNECGQLAKLLQTRIESRRLQEDARSSHDIETYCAEIAFFIQTYGRAEDEPAKAAETQQRVELENLKDRYEEAQFEIATLKSMVDERNNRLRDALHHSSLPECDCEAKLSHIKRLHEAITWLGLHPQRKHGLDSWEDLRSELPHMLDHIRGMDEQLKRVQPSARSPSPTPSGASMAHRRHRSEPEYVNKNRSSADVRPRLPSPTESNISVLRDSLSTAGASTKSRNRRSRGTGFFSNQGGGT